jgi:actin-like ATPase involved in cell morphogenesis
MPYRLGVDLGTTFTAAAVTDGPAPTLVGLGNRALQIPSVLFLKEDGEFLVGEAAERRGLSEPDRLAREFKRRIGDHVPIMLAGTPFSAQALTARLLRWVVETATERMGEPPHDVVLTHPASWGPFRLELLAQVAVMAGVDSARRCTEPEAAAAQYAAQTRVNPGDRVAVYDLGGGTFDACVLDKTDHGFRALGTPEGVEHLGGVDFDEAVLRHVLATLNTPVDPDDPEATVGLARLRRDCTEAKEALSTDVDTLVPVAIPGLSTTVRITRAEFEDMIRPALTETISATNRALHSAGVEPTQLRSILLVGGSSRIPLVSEMLRREFSVLTALDTHPKHDVALGSVRTGQDETDITAPAVGDAADQPSSKTPGPAAVDLSWRLLDQQPAAPVSATEVSPPAPPRPGSPPPGSPPARSSSPAELGTANASLSPPSRSVENSVRSRSGGLVWVALAVVLAAVVLGVGAGVFIALSDDNGVVAGPPIVSATPASPPVSPSISTPTFPIPTSSTTLTSRPTATPSATGSASVSRSPDPSSTTQGGGTATFEHFKVTVQQVRRGSDVQVLAEVCVRSLPPNPQGDRTRISWDPWSVWTGSRSVDAGRSNVPLKGAFPIDRTYRVGECGSGWIPFPTTMRPLRIDYRNGIGDAAVWDAEHPEEEPRMSERRR